MKDKTTFIVVLSAVISCIAAFLFTMSELETLGRKECSNG